MSPPLFDIIDRIVQEEHDRQLFNPSRFENFFVLNGGGEQLRDEAMEKALAKKEARDYRGRLLHALFSFRPGNRFTIEQLTGIVGRPPESVHYNAVGAIVRGMATRGLIRKTGKMLKAERPIMHATELAEWELVKYPLPDPEQNVKKKRATVINSASSPDGPLGGRGRQ